MKSAYGGGRRVGQEWVGKRSTQEHQQTGGGAIQTWDAGATPRGMRASIADKEEGRSKAGEATRTGNKRMGGSDNKGDDLASQPRRYRVLGQPCSTGIRWGVSPAAQMGCLRNRSGSPLGAHQP